MPHDPIVAHPEREVVLAFVRVHVHVVRLPVVFRPDQVTILIDDHGPRISHRHSSRRNQRVLPILALRI